MGARILWEFLIAQALKSWTGFNPQRSGWRALMRIVHIIFGTVNPDSFNGLGKALQSTATTRAEQGRLVEIWGCSIG
jgi:predicted nucleotidyltransferase